MIPLVLFFYAKYDAGPKVYSPNFEQLPFSKYYLFKCTYLAGQLNMETYM